MTVLSQATFAAADETALENYTPEHGPKFTITAGQWVIRLNRLVLSDSVVGQSARALINAGYANVIFSVNIEFAQEAYDVSLYFNWKNSIPIGNWEFRVATSNGNSQLYRRIPGGLSTLVKTVDFLPSFGTNSTFTVITSGDFFHIYADGVLLLSHFEADRTVKDQTYFGVLIGDVISPEEVNRVDNWLIEKVALPKYTENKILDHLFGGQTYTPSGTLYLGLSYTQPSEDNTLFPNFTEPDGSTGYSRISLINSKSNWTTATNGVLTNSTPISFTRANTQWNDEFSILQYLGIFDNSVNGNMLIYQPINIADIVTSGTQIIFPSGSIKFNMN